MVQTVSHRIARVATLVGLIAALALLVGCGSNSSSKSSNSSSSGGSSGKSSGSGGGSSSSGSQASNGPLCSNGQPTCVSQSPNAPVSGPKSLDANLTKLMAVSDRNLKKLKLSCPANQAGFPKRCTLSAIDTGRGKPHPVTGKVNVLGVYTRTGTYVYQAIYGSPRTK